MSNQSAGGVIVDPTRYRFRALGAAIAGYAYDAIDLMCVALVMPLIMRDWNLDMVQGGFIMSAMLVGGVFGGYVFGPIADKMGRKKALVWCIVFFGVMTFLTGFTQDMYQMAVLRFLAGLGLGAEWALGATMLAEFTPAEKRGKANSFMQMGWPIGFIVALIGNFVLVGSFGWRALYFLGGTAVFVGLYIQLALPESPMWLKAQEAKKSGAAAAAAATSKISDLFSKANRKTFFFTIVICTSALMAYWGVNTWLPTLLAKERDMTTGEVSNFLIILNVISFPAYLMSAFIIEKIGKRVYIIISALLSALTLYFWLSMTWDPKMFLVWGSASWFVASMMWSGFGAYIAEQFPIHIRAVGVASSFSTGRGFAVFVPMALGAAALATANLTVVIAFLAIFYLVASIAAFMLKGQSEHM